MSALTVQVLRLSLSLGSVTAVNLRRSVCGAQGSLDRSAPPRELVHQAPAPESVQSGPQSPLVSRCPSAVGWQRSVRGWLSSQSARESRFHT